MPEVDADFQLEQELLRRELARRNMLDFTCYTMPEFQPAPFIKEVCDILDAFEQAVLEKRSPRFMLWLPPGHSKSELVSRRFPAYFLGRNPKMEWVTATYNADFAEDFGRDVRRITTDPRYLNLFPKLVVRKDSSAVDHWETTVGGKYTAVGVGGALTGRRGHILSIDDPIKGKAEYDSEAERKRLKDWYMSVFRTRIHPGAGIMVTNTRWGEDDLAGFLLDVAAKDPEADQWMIFSFPAIAEKDDRFRKTGEALHPERFSLKELSKIRAGYKAADDLRSWYSLYQQNPVPPEGIHFKREWVQYGEPPKGGALNHYASTDFAIGEKTTSDRTCVWPFSVDEQDNVYFGIPRIGRYDALGIVDIIVEVLKAHHVLQLAIENVHISKTIGPFLQKRLREERIYRTTMWEYTATKDKVARSASLRGRMQQRKVFFHPQCKELIETEFLPFPGARHDDSVDAASVAMLMLETLVKASPAAKPPEAAAPEWSWTWMQSRIQKKHDGDGRKHVPRKINGREREPKKRGTSWVG